MGNKFGGKHPKPRQHTPAPRTPVQAYLEGLTNWQRNQWAKAGYPGYRYGNWDLAKLEPFAQKVHP